VDPETLQAARENGVRLLARREHATLELRLKLSQRGYPEAVIDAVVRELVDRGYLSDERFADVFIRQRVEQGYGPLRIVAEMRERGVDESVYRPFLDALQVDWLEQARAQKLRRFGDGRPKDRREWGRQGRYLSGRGFSADQILRVLGEKGD